MFRFEQPWVLILLLVPLLVGLWLFLQRKRQVDQYADAHLLAWVQVKDAGGGRHWFSPLVMLGVAWCAWVVALANPQWRESLGQRSSERVEVLVLLDLSRSMAVEDVSPSRLAVAKTLLDGLVNELPHGSRIGFRVFDGQSHWVHGLTEDRTVFRHFLMLAKVDTLPSRGSRVELALQQTAEALGMQPAAVLLVTDGHAPYWEDQPGLKPNTPYGRTLHLVTVGIGTLSGGSVPNVQKPGVLYFRNEQVHAPLARNLLRQLTQQLGGVYLDYTPGMLPELVKQLARHKKEPEYAQEQWQWKSLGLWPMGAGFILFLLAFYPWRWPWHG